MLAIVEDHSLDTRQIALLKLGRLLRSSGYAFVTPTPETHRRVLARGATHRLPLQDVFGWNRSFSPDDLPPAVIRLLEQAACVTTSTEGGLRSLVRFSSLGRQLFVHSPFPTDAPGAVFFGPDTYRFARAIAAAAREWTWFAPKRIVDIGAGSGAGGLFCATLFPDAERIILADINRDALRFAAINAALNDVDTARVVESDVAANIDGPADLIIANPPYLVDPAQRTYRHGGGAWGCDLAIRIVDEGLSRLTRDGKLLLYTGTPIVDGRDEFFQSIRPLLETRTASYRYEEIDPDVFGEELMQAPYDRADRIAVVMLIVDAEHLRC